MVFITELEAGGGDSLVVTATQSRHNAVTEEVSGFEQVKRGFPAHCASGDIL